MRELFAVNESVHLSNKGCLVSPEAAKDIMADILTALMTKQGMDTANITQAGVFLQDGCKTLIPVVNGVPLFDLEKSFTLAVKAHGRICNTPKLFLEGSQDAFTMGFLAAHGFVAIRIKEHNIPWLQQRYHALTEEELPDPEIKGNYFSVSDSDKAGSGDYYHLGFPRLPIDERDRLSFGSYVVGNLRMAAPIRWDDWESAAKYNSKNYVMTILGLGFRLGKNKNNLAQIRANMKDQDAFDQGCQYDISGLGLDISAAI